MNVLKRRFDRTDHLCVNAIRMLSVDSIEKAKSGHPGLPMGAAPMAYVLWNRIMQHNPSNPNWLNRDRFVLSAGHGSMLLYSLLHLSGYDLPIEELQRFRQPGSLTPGHPEYGHTPGVEATTGPLGQGVAMAVGMAMAERYLASVFNREGYDVIDQYTFALCGDGDLMEGVSAESASLAGHLRLGKLILLYDSNDISLDGKTVMTFTENVGMRFEAYGWQVLRVDDGNNLDMLNEALRIAVLETKRPTLIEVKTTIGFGSPNKSGTSDAHGAPLGSSEVELVRKQLNWQWPPFEIPDEVRERFAETKHQGELAELKWNRLKKEYRQLFPELAEKLSQVIYGRLPENWTDVLPVFEPENGTIASRDVSGKVINAIADKLPNFLGGSADLASSNKTTLKSESAFGADHYRGRNIWFGVREFAMAAILNGMSLHGGLRVYGGTFFVFSDYLKPAMRLSALMGQPVIYILTHDSIAVGEDGPTHEPIEQLIGLRSIPNMIVFRPADANETVQAYKFAIEHQTGPVSMVLTRQALPVLPRTRELAAEYMAYGAYVLADSENGRIPDIILIATGSEVSLAMKVRELLLSGGICCRVVSMPSWELFERQEPAYRESVLPSNIDKRVSIEMAHPLGWERYVGRNGLIIGIDQFGISAPGEFIMEKYGFTAERIVKRIMEFYKLDLSR